MKIPILNDLASFVFLSCLISIGGVFALRSQTIETNSARDGLISALRKDIEGDLDILGVYDRSIALAWLGKIEGATNPAKGSSYYRQSVALLSEDIAKSGPDAKAKIRCATASIVAPLIENNPETREELRARVTCKSDSLEQDLLDDVDRAIDAGDSVKAAQLWREGLAKGYQGYRFIGTIGRFQRFKDDSQSSLFSLALNIAPKIKDKSFHFAMAVVVLPSIEGIPLSKVNLLPPALRARYLQILAELVSQAGSPQERCDLLSVGRRLLDTYTELLPQFRGTIFVGAEECDRTGMFSWQEDKEWRSLTSDELLKRARSAKEEKKRYSFFLMAAVRAQESEDYDEALRILDLADESSDPEKLATTLRKYYVGTQAQEFVAKGDLASFFKVLNSTPAGHRADLEARVLRTLPDDRRSFGAELMDDLFRDLEAAEAFEKAAFTEQAIGYAAQFRPKDQPMLFQKYSELLNVISVEKSKGELSEKKLEPAKLPVSLTRDYLKTALGTARETKEALNRLSLRLGILQSLVAGEVSPNH